MRRADSDGRRSNADIKNGRGRDERCAAALCAEALRAEALRAEALPQYEGFFAEFYDILHSSY
ncbi:MAG TPA: hypothetical protein PKM31_02455, partial [Bacillota bacterium]|nr:hypothetical protein [Bacillota bacterium]